MTATLDELIDGLQILICGLDEAGTIRLFNRPCERLTGIPRTDAVGKSWLDLFADDQRTDHVMTLWSEAREDAPSGPYEALCRQGRNLRWHFSRSRKLGVGLWAVGIDVTREREALVRAREIERVVGLGNMLSGLTHELRNPLNGALLQLTLADRNLIRRRDETLEPVLNAVAQATSEVRRISSILDDFMLFVRPKAIHLERTDVRRVVARAIERNGPRARAGDVAVSLSPGGDALAQIDGSRVEAAVYQMIANAIDAATEASIREVHVQVVATGNTISIEVADRGRGIPANAEVYEPFFTTKKGGTGLGLSIAQRVAIDHGGSIAHARRDNSTVFRLELPIVGGVAN